MNSDQMQAAAHRVEARLDALDLDDDERHFLLAVLSAGANSVLPAGDEVEGYAVDAFRLVQSRQSAQPDQLADDESPKETITFTYGGLTLVYTQQGAF